MGKAINNNVLYLLAPIQSPDVFHFSSMMQKISIAILFILMSVSIHAQQVIYTQTFEDTATLFQNYVLANLDHATPVGTDWDTLKTVPWIVRTAGPEGNHAAIATSNYDPATAADDWFITPAIRLGKTPKLSWKSLSLTSGTTDTYEIFVSTTEQSVAGCLFNGPAATFTSSDASAFSSHTLDLSDTSYANHTVFIGFRLNTKSGGDKLAIDDIQVTEYSTQFVTLKFIVNMSNYIADSLFNPRTDTVDIAGTFNKFVGTKNILSIVPGSDSTLYSTTIAGFLDGDRLEFKFRINSTWNDTSAEFPYGKPNRVWVIEHDKYTYTCYYNDQGTPFGIPDNAAMDAVKIYPNPADANVSIEIPETISRILLVSLSGSKIIETDPHLVNKLNMDVSRLATGTYLMLFYTKNGFIGSEKLIKN